MVTITRVSHGNNQFGWVKHSVKVGLVQWEGPNLSKEFFRCPGSQSSS